MIRVQAWDFDQGAELAALAARAPAAGGIASFTGLVRGDGVRAMTLEHYPGMTERQIEAIAAEARRRWPILDLTVIHRFGRLEPGARIVFVAVAASHRREAFEACDFLMDWLKTKAPFWKREETDDGERWVEAKDSDAADAARWDDDNKAGS